MFYLILTACLGCDVVFEEVPDEVYTIEKVRECFPNFSEDGGYCIIEVEGEEGIEILHEGCVKKGDKVRKFCSNNDTACYYKYTL